MTGVRSAGGRLPQIAVLGAGHVGPVIARVALDAGYHTTISASGDPDEIRLITRVLVPGAEPRWAADAVGPADIVVLAIPLHAFASFDPDLVAGKLVVDVMNYWPPVDGVQEMFEDRRFGTSEIVARRLADTVRFDSLKAGRLFEAGGPVFGVSLHRDGFQRAVRALAA